MLRTLHTYIHYNNKILKERLNYIMLISERTLRLDIEGVNRLSTNVLVR